MAENKRRSGRKRPISSATTREQRYRDYPAQGLCNCGREALPDRAKCRERYTAARQRQRQGNQ